MKVLVIKTSSLGDVVHTLPALTDAAMAIPDIRFDWIVEKAFAEIPAWHPTVENVIPVTIRHWRRHPIDTWLRGTWSEFKARLQSSRYDAVIDAQGLLKSAWLIRYARGKKFGLDRHSAREPLAACFYDAPQSVPKGQHAIERVRQLFGKSLGYPDRIQGQGRYQLNLSQARGSTVVLLHGTTWPTKHWPEQSWMDLSAKIRQAGYRAVLPWGSEVERLRAERIAATSGADVLDRMNLTELAGLMASAAACISVDTGLGHLAAAVNTPTISLFGPTNPELTGLYGDNQIPLPSRFHCAPCLRKKCTYRLEENRSPPCFDELSADKVFAGFTELVGCT